MCRTVPVFAIAALFAFAACSDRSNALRIRDIGSDLGTAEVLAGDLHGAPEVIEGGDVAPDLAPSICDPVPPAAALLAAGPLDDGGLLAPGGRRTSAPGETLSLVGFPSQVLLHPSGQTAYVSSLSRDDRRLLVVDLTALAVVQEIDRGESHRGLALSPDASRLYASGGVQGTIDVFDVAEDHTLSAAASLAVGGYVSDVVLSADGATLWAGMLDSGTIVEVDTETGETLRTMGAGGLTWDLLLLEGRGEIYATDLRGEDLTVIDLATGERAASLALPTSPAGLAARPDEGVVWAAVSGADEVAAIDPETRTPVAWGRVAGDEFAAADGTPLGNSNPNAIAYDATRGRLYVSCGADNTVSVLDAATLALEGRLPSRWYPTDVVLAGENDASLVVLAGKGAGMGPSEGRSVKDGLAGTLSLVELASLDLAAATAEALANYERPAAVFPFDCAGDFPVPTREGQVSPIEHVVLIVKENKTFDCVLGDLDDLDVDVDPDLVRWGEEITPNLHALARAFALSDNFYTEVPNSDTGHTFLTSAHLTEFVERIWKEKTRNGIYPTWPIDDAAVPEVGNFFTHLLDHDVSIRIYGEIVGMFAAAADGTAPIAYSDANFPGGPATTYAVKDEDKARYVASRIEEGELADFTYLLLPNDHTQGTTAGFPTPESMVADNDYAVGIVVEALAASGFWDKSVVFVLQDDPQGCEDHVDGHRSFLVAVGPWIRRGYVSHVHASFLSLFATMERILGVPPMGRPDASVSPMWDLFATGPDNTPFSALERRVPEEVNAEDAPGAKASAAMDFRSPDRNPYLGIVLDAYRLWRMGRITREEAERRIADPRLSDEELRELVEESAEDTLAFDRDWARYQRWLQDR